MRYILTQRTARMGGSFGSIAAFNAASVAACNAAFAAAAAAHIESIQPRGAFDIIIQPILQSILKARSRTRSAALVCCTNHLPKLCLSETNCFTVMKPNDSAISISCAAVRTHHSYLGTLQKRTKRHSERTYVQSMIPLDTTKGSIWTLLPEKSALSP